MELSADLLVTYTGQGTRAKAVPCQPQKPGTSGGLGVPAPAQPHGPAKWELKRSVSPLELWVIVLLCFFFLFLFERLSCSFAVKFNDHGLVKK